MDIVDRLKAAIGIRSDGDAHSMSLAVEEIERLRAKTTIFSGDQITVTAQERRKSQ